MEYKTVTLDHIHFDHENNSSLSLSIDTWIESSEGPVKINNWRRGYNNSQKTDLINIINQKAPGVNQDKVTKVLDVLWGTSK